jgi:hypothetical protein
MVVVVRRWKRSIETGAKSTRGKAEKPGEGTQGIGPNCLSSLAPWLFALCVPFEVGGSAQLESYKHLTNTTTQRHPLSDA